ncbi:PadR family transcriptional regulator [Luteimonas lutimaris]|uniref:PadR family transcriptional regulator n=1 Tax=Luteimonas lutimaris TaxID=698645 RepID=A0ABP7M4K8_9GAMM|nr:PadR family transcriptional regulator [Luteimonas sp.]
MHNHHSFHGHRERRFGAGILRELAGRRGHRDAGDRFDGDDFGFGGRHGRGPGAGRVFGHGDLKLVLLSLIAEQPRHGYELIRTIEDMFEGTYAPSPGAVYPTLTLLEEMGHARVDEDGTSGRKRYVITDDGRAFLDANREAVEAVMARMETTARAMSRRRAPMLLRRAMHELRHALMERRGHWDAAEAERIRAILEQAAVRIRDGAA